MSQQRLGFKWRVKLGFVNPTFSREIENEEILGYVVFSAPVLWVNGPFVPMELLGEGRRGAKQMGLWCPNPCFHLHINVYNKLLHRIFFPRKMLTWCKQKIQKYWKQPWWLISIRAVGLLASLWKKPNSSFISICKANRLTALSEQPTSPPPRLSTRALVGPALESLSCLSVYLSVPVIMHTILLAETL